MGMIKKVLLAVAVLVVPPVLAFAADENADRLERLEREVRELKASANDGGAGDKLVEASRAVLDRVKVGGYGSMRFEGSDLAEQKHSFVFRRFVLTADADIAPRLKANFELEFERFRKLELEKEMEGEQGGLRSEFAVEGSNKSEIALEQMYLQYEIADWLKLRAGGLLVPVGRFNLNHDDNRWDLPRRSLIDRGVPVLPSTAAWDEVGLGFTGDVELPEEMMAAYQVYVMNGVALDSEVELIGQTRDPKRDKLAYEAKISPSTGGFAGDVKDAKAIAGRIALSPALGHEIAGSWYYGQYTPDFLGKEDLWTLGLDGRSEVGPFEIEAEGLFTRFEGTKTVARGLASVARDSAAETASADAPDLETEVEFELAGLARNKYGYWIDLRYRFWPEVLNETFLGATFANPRFVAVLRGEQAWLEGLVEEVGFENGALSDFRTQDRRVDRITTGLAYRPVPLVAFQLAYEFTQTNRGHSLASVTNYLPAGEHEDRAHTVMLGTAFGF